MLRQRTALGAPGAVVVANPLDEQLDPELHDRVLREGLQAAAEQGIAGRDVTPFLLERFHTAHGRREPAGERPARPAQRGAGRGDRRRVIVVLGDVMTDVVAVHDAPLADASDTPARITLRAGGAGANTAAWLAHAGVAVTLIARTGDDSAADLALAGLEGVDLRVTRDPERPTGTCIVLVAPGGERTMLPDPGANDALSKDDLPDDVFTAGDVLHVSGYSLLRSGSRGAALEAMARAREAGMLDQRRSRVRGARCATTRRSWTGRGRSTCCSPTPTSSPSSTASCPA